MPSLLGSFVKESTSEDKNSATERLNSDDQSKELKSNDGDENISKSRINCDDEGDEVLRPSFSDGKSKSNEVIDTRIPFNQNKKLLSSKLPHQMKRIPNTGFILYEQLTTQCSSINLLQQSAAKQGLAIKYETQAKPNSCECTVQINGRVYAKFETSELNKKEAKTKAFDDTLAYARKVHYTIKVNIAIFIEFHLKLN